MFCTTSLLRPIYYFLSCTKRVPRSSIYLSAVNQRVQCGISPRMVTYSCVLAIFFGLLVRFLLNITKRTAMATHSGGYYSSPYLTFLVARKKTNMNEERFFRWRLNSIPSRFLRGGYAPLWQLITCDQTLPIR